MALLPLPSVKYNDDKTIFIHLGEVIAKIESQQVTDSPQATIIILVIHMKYFAWIIIICLPFIASCQDKSKINIKAQYISLFLKDSTGNGYWKDIQKTPAGVFLCQEQDNGNLIIHFNRFDPQSEFINATKNYTDVIPKIPNDICGFRFKGIYYLESQPVDIAYAMYYDTKRPNSLVIVKYAGQTIIGANFHSDKQANPLKEANIRF